MNPKLEMLSAREQLMSDIECIIEMSSGIHGVMNTLTHRMNW
jgi:hypothetical protein